MFWILWFFIAFIIVLVAFTLRKETEEMPRREILRAVESTGGMGISERAFLWVFSWMDTRFRIQDYWNMSKGAYYNMHRQMPLTHAEKYNLRNISYWYPLYSLGGISFLSFIILVLTGTILGIYYVPGGEGDPSPAYASMEFIMLELPFGYIIRAVHHWGTHFMVVSVFLHMCRAYFTGAYRNPRELNWLIGSIDGTHHRLWLLRLSPTVGHSHGAAVIGINLANSSPLIGKYIATLLFGGSSLTPRTVTRMYFIHVFILPVIVTTLIIIHLFIVWVQGIAEPH